MTRYILTIAALAVAAVTTGSAQQQPTFPSRVELVTVDVVVIDRNGNPIEGLRPEDFTVREDGTAQQVAAFEAISLQQSPEAAPRRTRVSTNGATPDTAGQWFFVVFDDVNITQFATPRARAALAQFIEQALRPGDHVMLMASSGGASWTGELPGDREDLIAFVQRLSGQRRFENAPDRIWDHEAMAITNRTDPQAQAQVARRFFENDIIVEAGAAPSDAATRREVDVSPGIPMIQVKARQTYLEAQSRIHVSLGSLERISTALASTRGRKSLLFFSEGFIMDSTLPDFRTLVQTARNANVAVHFIDVSGPEGAVGQAGMPGASAETGRAIEDRDTTTALALSLRDADGTRSVATDTGGTTVSGTNLLAGLTRIANEGRAYYLLGYTSTNTSRDGAFRKIAVTVNRPNVTVRARSGYFAPSAEPQPIVTSPDTLDPSVRTALDSPFGSSGIPLRLTSYVLGPQVGGKVQTVLVADADPAPLRLEPREGRYTATLDSYVLVHNGSRDSLDRNETLVELDVPADQFPQIARTGIPIRREFSLDPGIYQATLVVRDRATGTIGSVRHEFVVEPLDAFRITSPVITDEVLPAAGAGQPPRPVPIARRAFKAGSRIAVAFDVLGVTAGNTPAPVSVTYAIRRADGSTVAASQPQTLRPNARGQFPVLIGVTLPAGAVGDHELYLTVRDEGSVRVIEYAEPIVITP